MNTIAVAIEFGTSKIVALVGDLSYEGQGELRGYGIAPYDGYMDGQWNGGDEQVVAAMQKAIKDAERMSGEKIESLYVGVPCEYLRIMSNQTTSEIMSSGKKIGIEDVDDIMEKTNLVTIQNGVIIHKCPAYFTVDGERTMEPVGLKGDELGCMSSVIVCDAGFIADIEKKLGGIGVKIEGYMAPALGQSLMLIQPEERDKLAVLIDTGYITTEIMVVQGDAVVRCETLASGGGHITADIAEEFNLNMALAEQLKRKYVFYPSTSGVAAPIEIMGDRGETIAVTYEELAPVIERRTQEMAAMIKEELEKEGSGINADTPIYFTGGGVAAMRGAREHLSHLLGWQLKAPSVRPGKLTGGQYTSALGLLELVYEQISQSSEIKKENFFAKWLAFIKSLFGKK